MTAPRNIGEAIFLQMEDFRAWRWSECPEWEESMDRLDSILRQCESDAERAYVMRVARNSPVKNTPGRDPDAEVNDWALKVLAHADAHGTKINAVADTLLKAAGILDAGIFHRVLKRAYVLRAKRKKPAPMLTKSNSRLEPQSGKSSSARDLPSNAPPPLD